MRLKTVSIKGFKSFADPTALHFNEEVTGVVGPNGSGKSNIVDAIRWVLGEMKNKELRLERMNDVIFNGTKKRKRSGAAKVTLTFENTRNLIPTEYHTVSISRLLYQNGDSEYRLNDVVCRRKDIINLFVDTGIGSNSYAIIGQGNINQVVEGREGSRRRMIEQAAGISKYKARKKEATQKLAATDADLNRVEDLLFELERNLKDLERQAKRAKRYREVKVQYKEKSISLAVLASEKYRSEYHELKERITKEKDHLSQLRTQLHQSEAELEKAKKLHVDLEATVSSSQKEMNSLLDELRRKESSKEIKRQRLKFLEDDLVRLQKSIEEAKRKLEETRVELNSSDRQRSDLQGQKEARSLALEKAQNAYQALRSQHESAREDLQKYVQNRQSLGSAVFNLEKGIAINKNRIEGHRFTSDKIDVQIEDAKRQFEHLNTDVKEYSEQKNHLLKEIEELRQAEEEHTRRQEQLTSDLEEIRKQVGETQRTLDKIVNQRDLIQSMVDNLEGFPESVRFLRSQWSQDAVLLSDIIDCPPSYRATLEAYLEPYLNHFIVESADEAIKAVELLNQSQKGKAQFLILSELRELKKEQIIEAPQGTTSAISIIESNGQYKEVFDYLLPNVHISDDTLLVASYSGPCTILSSDGSLVRKRAQLKGGSVGLFEGKKLGRKKELERLEKEAHSLTQKSLSLQEKESRLVEQLSKLKSTASVGDLREREALLNQLNEKYVSASTRLEGIKSQMVQGQTTKQELEAEILTLTEENENLQSELVAKQQTLDGLESEIQGRGGEVDQWVGKISLASEELNRTNKDFMIVDNQEKSILQRINYLNEQYQSLQKTIDDGELRLRDEEEERRSLHDDLNKLEQTLLEEYQSKQSIQQSLNDIEKDYYEERKKIVAKEEEVRELNRRIRSYQESIEKNTQTYSDVRLKLHSITDRMEVEFGVTLKEIMDEGREVAGNFEQLEQEVHKLRRRLETFGEINPMALEAYEEMKERYDSIQQQRTDILEAKESLLSTISEIEEQATGQFFEAFDQVKEHFRDVFRQLFTEDDDCDLILTTPEDPLNSAIEVVARPKGKRPKTLTQLSGGEKAMTAIALLFALYLLKPAPFCIFDEVDAPFDDMNVSKFNDIMRRFAAQSQFIVITHNKLTMAKMDVLYGIFMQEPGVSNVSQVDFRSFKDELVFEA